MKHPHAGGSELYFYEMAKEWVKKGHEVTWFSPAVHGAGKEEIESGIHFIRKGNKASVYLWAAYEYLKRLRHQADIIIDLENGIPFFTPLYSRKKKVLHIHHLHKDQWYREYHFPITQLGRFLEEVLMPKVYKKVKVITLAKSWAEEIEKEGIGKEKPMTVAPGITFCKYKKTAKTKFPSLLFLNRVRKYKGIEVLIDAAALLKNIENLKVYVAGEGEDLKRVKKISKEKGLEKKIIFLGRVSEEKKSEFMQKAWIFVNPSFKEGWGIVNIEANYHGTPVIGSDAPGIKDSVKNGQTGLLFEKGNAQDLAQKINALFNNKKLREKMGRNAVKWAENFAWRKKAEEYLNLLKSA